MRLLICVQSVDTTGDPLMAFFHGWLTELSKHFVSIHVICLREGVHVLPKNVFVHSLGKESGENRIKYILRFYRYVFSLRGNYDRVFVHMNPHYVLLGGLYWWVRRIPIFFWRNHAKMNVMTQIAARFAKRVFYTSPYACTSVFPHALQMPVGIDTRIFTPGAVSKDSLLPKKILFLGRISPVKCVELFIDAGNLVTEKYEFHIYGDDPTKEKKYLEAMKARAGASFFFHPSVKNEDTPAVYRAHDLYVNLTPEGSMDKTVLEAIACGIPTLVANTSFKELLPATSLLSPVTKEQLAKQIVVCVTLSEKEQEAVVARARSLVVEKHSLEKLATMLYNIMQ